MSDIPNILREYTYIIERVYTNELACRGFSDWLFREVGDPGEKWIYTIQPARRHGENSMLYVGFMDSEDALLFNLKF